jgi:hypothetical protein
MNCVKDGVVDFMCLIGGSCIYIVNVIPDHFKFGLTTDIQCRLATHKRKLNYTEIIAIIDCGYDTVMRRVETEFKRYIIEIGIQRNMFGQTEIIETDDINQYVKWFEDRINLYNQEPQPANRRNIERAPAVLKVEVDVIDADNKKCNDCGHVFKNQWDFDRHKNRKTPCLIREVAEIDRANPNRCIYCNKVYANINNLKKHLKTCKIKNGGMDILDGNVRLDQEIRIMKEQREVDRHMIADIKQQNVLILRQLEILTKQLQ